MTVLECPYCSVTVHISGHQSTPQLDYERSTVRDRRGYLLISGNCPSCQGLIVVLSRGVLRDRYLGDEVIGGGEMIAPILSGDPESEIIYPHFVPLKVSSEVPETYRKDFQEASAIVSVSSKASAAMSRRLLERLLSEIFNLQEKNLDKKIESFLQRGDVPSILAEYIDAIRVIGNLAAHPTKNTNTGEIVDVEPQEAEWLLEVLDRLFDFAFVQPLKDQKSKENLKNLLQQIDGNKRVR